MKGIKERQGKQVNMQFSLSTLDHIRNEMKKIKEVIPPLEWCPNERNHLLILQNKRKGQGTNLFEK